jgi:hypothetical protein
MKEQVPPDSDAADDKAVIQSQDLEHQPTPATRVPNKGVKVPPPALDRPGRRDLEKGENETRKSVEEFEQSMRHQYPGDLACRRAAIFPVPRRHSWRP